MNSQWGLSVEKIRTVRGYPWGRWSHSVAERKRQDSQEKLGRNALLCWPNLVAGGCEAWEAETSTVSRSTSGIGLGDSDPALHDSLFLFITTHQLFRNCRAQWTKVQTRCTPRQIVGYRSSLGLGYKPKFFFLKFQPFNVSSLSTREVALRTIPLGIRVPQIPDSVVLSKFILLHTHST